MFDSNKVYLFQSSHVKVTLNIAQYFNIQLSFRYRFVVIWFDYHDFDKVLILLTIL